MVKKFIFFVICIFSLSISVNAASLINEGKSSIIDVTEASAGRIKAAYKGETSKKIKVTIEKGTEKYTYDLNGKGGYEYYPLQMGDGSYKIKVLENSTGNKYAVLQTLEIQVKLDNEFAPYKVSSQFINYSDNSGIVQQAAALTKDSKSDLEKVAVMYDFVVKNISYDYEKAKTVSSGYVPSPDEILKKKTGICFDYSSVLAAMLRSQNIPAKLVMGYVVPDGVYHAWNEVYITDVGWVKVGLYNFDGKNWKLMDSTFDSTSQGSQKGIEYINNAANYTKKYQY